MNRKELSWISILKRQNLLLIGLLICAIASVNAASVPCALREEKYGGVCVCNATYCDYLEEPTPTNEADFVVISSTKAGLRFEATTGRFNLFKKFQIADYDQRLPVVQQAQQQQEEPTAFDPISVLVENGTAFIELTSNNERAQNTRSVRLNIDRAQQHKKIVGFGGSFTGAVSHLTDLLSPNLQDHLYKSYYAAEGIGFNLMRISIGGCDFDLAPWAYSEEPINDPQLPTMTQLDARDLRKVAQIKRLKDVSKVEDLLIKGAAWSSPRWMKSNNRWTGRSHLKQEYYQAWADYHLKWLELWEANGLPIWAISTGNEPLNGVAFMVFVKFMSLGWTPGNQAIWLADYLGPTIRNSKYKDVVIFGNDDQRYTYPTWLHIMKSKRPNSLDFLNGLAVHWYWDEMVGPQGMDQALAENPDKIMLVTESCIGDKPWQKAAPLLGSWERGEKYARDFLQNLQHGINGWIDWNLILDEKGGPNYVNNTVDAPIIVNTQNPDEILKQPMFYTIGHFTKFIPRDSIRIEAVRNNVNVDSVAYLRPDGSICAVLFNSGKSNVEINVVDSVRGTIVVNIPPRSIHTLIYL